MKILLILSITISIVIVDAIHGGENAAIEDIPYTVELFKTYTSRLRVICGAAILSESWVITAAHCVQNDENLLIRQIRVGANTTLGSDGELHNISQIVTHEDYSPDTFWNSDVSLIELADPITFNEISQPISIANESLEMGSVVTVSGYGDDHATYGKHLKVGEQTVISLEACKEALEKTYRKNVTIDNRVFCTDSTIVDLGHGDSGGPAVIDGKLIGIASDGNESPLPNIFVNVVEHYDWIVNVTGLTFN